MESERVLLSAEWLLRDVAIEELLPHSQAEAAVNDVVSCVQTEVDRRRLRRRRGRRMIEDQLETLLEYRSARQTLHECLMFLPELYEGECCNMG